MAVADPTQPHEPYPVALRWQALATERPDQTAISDGAESFTYSEVVHRAACVAAMVRSAEDKRPVGVLVNRSVRSVAAIVGVQWAGLPIVPLECTEPSPRLLQMLDRANVRAVVDATGSADLAASNRPVLDAFHLPTDVQPIEPIAADPRNTCTMFFTSGSTGVPKAIERSGSEGRVTWRLWDHPRLVGTWQHLAVFAPLNFAAGYLFAVLMPALGHRVTLVNLATTPLAALADLFEQTEVDCVAVTPSLVHALRSALDGRRLSTVRHVMTFGEGLEWSVVAGIRATCASDVTVQSLYGSSESLGMTVEHTIAPEVPIGVGAAPLGTPLDPGNLRLEPVEGSDGLMEMVAVRDVVTRYWDDPELSAQRFGVDADGTPFWRSGDLVSVDEHRVLHFRGRLDDMVKVNGRLVEPAEAEQVLRAMEGVRNAVLLPQRLGESRNRLVAHLETDEGLVPEDVQRELRRLLPAHLVPGVLVRHERLPITDRGKVDKGALRQQPVTPWRSSSQTIEGRVPADPAIPSLTAMFASVLQVPDLSPDDDVWHAGCDSLAALQILQMINDSYSTSLDANVFVHATTPRALAALLHRSGEHPPVSVMHPDGHLPPVHLIAGAGAPALQYRSLIWALGPEQPVIVHEQAGLHQRMPRDRSIRGHANRCADDVRTHQAAGPYTIIGHSYGGAVAIEVAVRLQAQGEQVRLVLLDTVPRVGADRLSALPTVPSAPRGLAAGLRRVRHRLRRPLWRRARRYLTYRRRLWRGRQLGSPDRYERFIWHANKMAVGHRPSVFDGPTLLLVTAENIHRAADTTPNRTVVQVPGGHTSMVYPPHVTEWVGHMRAWLDAAAVPQA